jgi:hypothetical protein
MAARATLNWLGFPSNHITSRGPSCICPRVLSALPSLHIFDLTDNPYLLDDRDTSQRSAQNVLMSQGARLQKLHLAWCSEQADGYRVIINTLEAYSTPFLLDISDTLPILPAVRAQLIESMPNMKGI